MKGVFARVGTYFGSAQTSSSFQLRSSSRPLRARARERDALSNEGSPLARVPSTCNDPRPVPLLSIGNSWLFGAHRVARRTI